MLNIFEQLPGYIAWKDEQHRYLGCNRHFAHLHHFKHIEDIIGMRDADFTAFSEEELTFYRNSDQLAANGKTLQFVHRKPSDAKLYHLQKQPLMNHDNIIIGTLFHCRELGHSKSLSTVIDYDRKYQLREPSHYSIDQNENTYNLSARELECLFCSLRGMTAKKTAEILHLSKRTIEFYLENIKNKFGSRTKADMLLLAASEGYMKIIPTRFIYGDVQTLFE